MNARWERIGEHYASHYRTPPDELTQEPVTVLYRETMHHSLRVVAHDSFGVIPDAALYDLYGDILDEESKFSDFWWDISEWGSDPITRTIIFHRPDDSTWDQTRRVIEEELAMRGYSPISEDLPLPHSAPSELDSSEQA